MGQLKFNICISIILFFYIQLDVVNSLKEVFACDYYFVVRDWLEFLFQSNNTTRLFTLNFKCEVSYKIA